MEQQIVYEFTHPIGEYALAFAIGFTFFLAFVMLGNCIYGLFKKPDPNDNMW